ncbi:MAG: hypothetical protein HQ453_00805 [Actinobacteria bacterium]|nr:hypothetical protein [Actinomycetota bacterium]
MGRGSFGRHRPSVQQPYQLLLLAVPLFIFTTLRLTQSQPVTIQLVSLVLLAAYGSAVSIIVNAATRMAPHSAVAVIIGSVPVLALSCVPLYLVLAQTGGDPARHCSRTAHHHRDAAGIRHQLSRLRAGTTCLDGGQGAPRRRSQLASVNWVYGSGGCIVLNDR